MGLLSNHICYLAGPIDQAKDDGKTWRKNLAPFLRNEGISVIDPTDSAFSNEDDSVAVSKINIAKEAADWDKATRIGKEVVQRDLRAVDLSSFVVAYINHDIFMCGSIIEIAHAAMQRKPVIICCEQGKEGVPNFLWGMLKHEMFFGSWDEVERYIINVNMGIEPRLNRWKFLDQQKL